MANVPVESSEPTGTLRLHDSQLDRFTTASIQATRMRAFDPKVAAKALAARARKSYPDAIQWIALGCLCVIGTLMGIIVIRRLPTRTMTRTERQMILRRSSSQDSANATS